MVERSPLISTPALARRLADDDVIVCDVRFSLDDHDRGRREYDEAHVPRARFVDLHRELADTSIAGGGRHPLPDPARFTDLLGRNGIEPTTLVVAYDSGGGATASRLWWMLRSIGHDRAAVLDGGWAAWVRGRYPVEAGAADPTPTRYPPATAWSGVVQADDVAAAIDAGVTVIDARAPERFRGESEPIDARAGHIPGAVNRFHEHTLGPAGTHLPAAVLAAQFGDVGRSPIVYCGSGVTACHDILAMALAGIDDARLYPGSWSDWSADPDRPVATA